MHHCEGWCGHAIYQKGASQRLRDGRGGGRRRDLKRVVNGLREDASAVVLGLIPLGTGNDFARTLELPTQVDEAIALLLAGHTRAIDLVRVTSDEVRYFVNVSAGGFSGLVDERLTPEMKKTWGPLAYLRGAAAALPDLRAYRTTVSLDNAESLTLSLYNVVIANGRYVGGGTQIAPQASIDDGLLDSFWSRNAHPLNSRSCSTRGARRSLPVMRLFPPRGKGDVNSRPGMWFTWTATGRERRLS